MTSHREQKSFKILIINYRNFFIYVQKIINKILRPFRKFCKLYINNIIIYSSLIKKHVKHFKQIFKILIKINIYLISRKLFFDYFFIHLLNQKINILDLIIIINKFVIIVNLTFLKILKQFEKYLRLIEYLY